MKRLIVVFAMLSMPALAQTPLTEQEKEIADAWKICAPYEVIGKLAAQTPWKPGAPNGCTRIRKLYIASQAAIDAKLAADKKAQDDNFVNEVAKIK